MSSALLSLALLSAPRVLQGPFGPFAGDDFDCEEKDIYRDEPWAAGACMIGCRRDGCRKAKVLCRRLPVCAIVNINVEGTVATLKRESALSARTSRGKRISFSQNLAQRAPGSDRACIERDVWTKRSSEACMLDCPNLNCTRATALCFSTSGCTSIDISFGVSGRGAVARLRFQEPELSV
mmetsp:Transcript_5820/g.18603  ORF Transcript_5820/g.18603 Transcript_5820/m.18603 type:complete len:180 (+) Transcript_5820:134-673(+)